MSIPDNSILAMVKLMLLVLNHRWMLRRPHKEPVTGLVYQLLEVLNLLSIHRTLATFHCLEEHILLFMITVYRELRQIKHERPRCEMQPRPSSL